MDKILIISFSPIANDPRVTRQIDSLHEKYKLTVVGYGFFDKEFVEYHSVTNKRNIIKKIIFASMLLFKYYDRYYWTRDDINEAYDKFYQKNFDIIIANDLLALPLACRISDGKSKIIFDAHEYAPREFEDILIWRLLYQNFNCEYFKKYMPKISKMMTVCIGIADEYERNFGIKPVVVTNAPSYRNLSPSPMQNNTIKMIHHGGALPSRHLEDMIEMMDYVDNRFTLDLMLMPSNKNYYAKLKSIASKNKKVRFIDPIPMNDIPEFCNNYDIGIFLLPPVNFNYKYALPNKIFEFIQARLALAIGPSPEMSRIVTQYNCGVIADTFSPKDLADKLNDLSLEQVLFFKRQSHIAAKELCAELNAKIILDLVETV